MTDIWADWLRTRRTGGDPEYERRMLEELATVRDKVLGNAGLASGESVLDVGCGNGLIAFGALERGANVVFADISRALLDDCRQLAADAGIADRCRFVEATATELDEIEDESIDVVTTRSVLIYVKDKERAFAEFHRVLRPGGRISLFEPVNRFGMAERRETFGGYDLGGVRDLMEKLTEVYARRQPPEDPMLDFDERDLIALAESAGFFPIHLEYRADIEPPEARNWDSFVHSSGNPKIPTLAEAMDEALTADERDRLVGALRPAVEEGRGAWRMGCAYLWAVKH
jgi:SAM-dependent methyltransferase